jgi:hypothetical protein
MERSASKSTLEYGSVIKIVSSNPYDGYFFVERLYDDKLVLLSDKGTITLDITDQELDDKTIEKFIIVYKPKQGFIFQNKLFMSQMIELEFEDGKVIGKIMNIKDQTIEVETKDGYLYIPLDRGLPRQIISIKKIEKEKEKDKEKEEEDDGLLDVFEEDIEEEEQFYYSIDQQKNDFLENLLMYIPVKERSPKKMKELNKMIKRYVELRTKYTTFSDGIYINHLQVEQIFATTIALENKMYVPVTKGIEVKLSETDLEAEDAKPKDSFFKETDIHDRWINDLSDLKENMPFNKHLEMIDNFDNLIYHTKVKANQMKYQNQKQSTLAYILGSTEYPLMIDKPFIIDSLITQPKFYFDYSKVFLSRSFVMEKSVFSLNPYYPSFYNIKNPNGTFCNDNRIFYKNAEDTYDKYIKKIIPTMEEFIECVNKPPVNMIDILNQTNILEINELNTENYLLANQIIQKNVNKIKQNFIKTRPSYLTKPGKDKIVENQITLDILTEYENLSKLQDLNRHYSSSEIFKMAEIDLFKLLTFQYNVRILVHHMLRTKCCSIQIL